MAADRPTLHLTNLSSRKPHGPGRLLHIQAAPQRFMRAACVGSVPALTPVLQDLQDLHAGRLAPETYRTRFKHRMVLELDLLVPGTLCTTTGAPVEDGDTLVCTCARDAAAVGSCHRVWSAEPLLAAGWDVVLDGVRLTTPVEGPCLDCEDRPLVGCCLDRRGT